ncbi:hypothetical protein IKF34_02275 [Candidatus Saccharibacteria bacterium]|nr:hypothetical protein [Candidatus Saccharibacteria bacterium]
MENNSFTVLPMSQRFTMNPGQTYTGSLTVVNPADATESLKYHVSVTPYGVVGEDYTADLSTTTGYSEIMNWIKIAEPKGEVAPNESREIEFTITVPEDAKGGGQYATIAVRTDNDKVGTDGVSVNSVFELASVVYGYVNGEIVRNEGGIIENKIPGVSAIAPVRLDATISNTSNVHDDATFVITVTDMFSGRVILPTEDDDGQYNEIIMPDSTRKITREVSNLPKVGMVKISQTIHYNGETSQLEQNVIICPIWFMLLVLATIIAIVWAVVSIVFRHKRKKSGYKKPKKLEE